jgi:RNA polymerase sigma factor (sigma-70 family)
MPSVFDSEKDEYFVLKLREFEPLLWYAANRFEIPGVLWKEDLYQEGLLALEESLDQCVDHPETLQFTRYFKSYLFHRMSDCLRRHKRHCRDWRREVREVLGDSEDPEVNPLARVPQDTYPSPDYALEMEAVRKYLEAVTNDLERAAREGSIWGNSAEDALELVKILTDPDLEVPEEVHALYERVPAHLSHTILAEITGWDAMKVRRALRRLRKHAISLAAAYGVR